MTIFEVLLWSVNMTAEFSVRVLGPGSDEVVSSGDPVADAFTRKRLLDAYNIRHQIVRDGRDQAVLVVEQEEWPLPIPLVRYNNTWRFDAQAGRRELVFRRIGRNEQGAIQASPLYVKAQREYPKKVFAGEGVYAPRFISQPGAAPWRVPGLAEWGPGWPPGASVQILRKSRDALAVSSFAQR